MGGWRVVEDEKGENLSAIFYTQFSEMFIEMEIIRLKILENLLGKRRDTKNT